VVEGIRLQLATPASHSPVQMAVAPAVGGRVVAFFNTPAASHDYPLCLNKCSRSDTHAAKLSMRPGPTFSPPAA
jgi:hypothetical protein